jgi:hypothetical protein
MVSRGRKRQDHQTKSRNPECHAQDRASSEAIRINYELARQLQENRRSVTDSVYFVLTDKATGLSFPFTNDKPGHFRSPDVGLAIKEIGEQVDVKAFAIDVNVAGYKKATITRMPRKTQGTIELDVRLEPAAGDIVAAGLSAADAPPFTRTWIILIGFLVLLVIVKVARTSGRPRTTTR